LSVGFGDDEFVKFLSNSLRSLLTISGINDKLLPAKMIMNDRKFSLRKPRNGHSRRSCASHNWQIHQLPLFSHNVKKGLTMAAGTHWEIIQYG
jgi:hypothetical protein